MDIVALREKLRGLRDRLTPGAYLNVEITEFGGHHLVARELLEELGLVVEEGRDESLLPMYQCRLPKRQERWEYNRAFLQDIESNPNLKVLDFGSGNNPWPRANVVADVHDGAKLPHQRFVSADICGSGFQNKEFDFVTAFHVLEHVNNPLAAAQELSRIAKAGFVECPLPWKDGMLGFMESDHRWIVLPGKNVHMVFIPINLKLFRDLHDPEFIGSVYRTYISNTDKTGDRAIMRNYFSRVEANLNVRVRWEGQLKVSVIDL